MYIYHFANRFLLIFFSRLSYLRPYAIFFRPLHFVFLSFLTSPLPDVVCSISFYCVGRLRPLTEYDIISSAKYLDSEPLGCQMPHVILFTLALLNKDFIPFLARYF